MAQLQGRCASARDIGGTGGGDPSDKIFLLFQNQVLVVWQKWSIMNVKNSEYFSIVVDEMCVTKQEQISFGLCSFYN